MKYIVNISPEEEELILGLIEKKSVLSIDHFIEVAVRNQLLLEADNTKIFPIYKKKQKKKVKIRTLKDSYQIKFSLNDYTKRENLSIKPISSEKPNNNINSLLWGQIYRIFPIKFNLRVLANLLNNEVRAKLEEYQEINFDLAFQLGRKLREIDIVMSRKRGNKLATGFPTDFYGKLGKSRGRYLTHYIGNFKKNLESEGCLSQLGLVKLKRTEDDEIYIQITELGLNFALSVNPIIDLQQYENSLTDEEIVNYIDSVRANLPYELQQMNYYLSTIEEGVNERNPLNEKMKDFYSSLPDEMVKWESAQVVNTMRTGLSGRLVELGMIEVHYIKQKAIYSIKRDDWRKILN